jgi:hypothetical protein
MIILQPRSHLTRRCWRWRRGAGRCGGAEEGRRTMLMLMVVVEVVIEVEVVY